MSNINTREDVQEIARQCVRELRHWYIGGEGPDHVDGAEKCVVKAIERAALAQSDAQPALPEGAREALEKAVAHFKDRWIAHRDAANASWDSRDNNRSMADKYWSAYCLLKRYCATKPLATLTPSSGASIPLREPPPVPSPTEAENE